MPEYKTIDAIALDRELRHAREDGKLPEIGSRPNLLDTGEYIDNMMVWGADVPRETAGLIREAIRNAAKSGKVVDSYIKTFDAYCASHNIGIPRDE